jgi:uncharacterized protein YacL
MAAESKKLSPQKDTPTSPVKPVEKPAVTEKNPSQSSGHEKKTGQLQPAQQPSSSYLSSYLPPRVVGVIADEVVKTMVERLPHLVYRPTPKKKNEKTVKKLEKAIFLDTSAIIDGRIFEVIKMGLLHDVIGILDSVLLELKHIADSQDTVKRERGKKGLERLEELKKARGVQVVMATAADSKKADSQREVDEKLIQVAKSYHGKVITCDYNLEKKAAIQGVSVINVNALANALKVTAVPGEALHIMVLHLGKEPTQGVGYLDDGTMIVIEQGAPDVGTDVDVVVSRVIQTSAGRILFAKKI